MKRVSALLICFILVFTNVSFASQSNHTSIYQKEILDCVSDMEQVNDRIYVLIKQIAGDAPLNTASLYKDIKFCTTILNSHSNKISNLYTSSGNSSVDIDKARSFAALLYTISLYQLSLASLAVYIDNDSKIEYFMDACATYQEGKFTLKSFKSENKSFFNSKTSSSDKKLKKNNK